MRIEIDIAEHHYNNIMALDSVSLGRVPYKGIIMYSINAIKHGRVLEQEPTTENDLEVQKAIEIIKADDLAPYSVEDILNARDLAVEALKQMRTTKNDSKFCPDRKAKTAHMETILHCIENECAAYKDGKCLKYNSDQEPTTKNDSSELEKNSKKLEEPQTFKWCTDCREYDQEKHCCHRWSKVIRDTVEEMKQEQEPIIDKIRAEIETKYGQCDICEYFEDYDYEENDISEYRPIGNIADILQIIDKYKAESEE